VIKQIVPREHCRDQRLGLLILSVLSREGNELKLDVQDEVLLKDKSRLTANCAVLSLLFTAVTSEEEEDRTWLSVRGDAS